MSWAIGLKMTTALSQRATIAEFVLTRRHDIIVEQNNMVNVLFVCLGNICRSSSAEAVFKAIVAKESALDASSFHIDSCGTGGGNPDWYCVDGWSYHEGEASDARMTKEARKRGYTLTSRARTLTRKDFDQFDYIICMEDKNRNAVLEAAEAWGGAEMKNLAKRKVLYCCSYPCHVWSA